MQFFFPDSQDLVDPSFDFQNETRGISRLRQRDDCYPHEIFAIPPYDGMLISKGIVEERYTLAQKQRLLRLGAREFLRINEPRLAHLKVMGDCGAFSYKDADLPPFSIAEVVDFYERCAFDYAISVDHVILDFDPDYDRNRPVPKASLRRQQITLEFAADFFRTITSRAVRFEPLGVAQGWSPASYRHAVVALQKIGYSYIAIGGLVPMKTADILATLSAVKEVLRSNTRLHLLGVTRCEQLAAFRDFQVVSFDSTSALLQAFKSDTHNYHTDSEPFVALRVPQVEGNPKLKAAILSGGIHQEEARRLEKLCLELLRRLDAGEETSSAALEALLAYEELHTGKTKRRASYLRVLEARPWQHCTCEICVALGFHVIVFRGAERNRRRGFHNLKVFYDKVQRLKTHRTAAVNAV
jgi:hypothetical protein